MKTLDYVGDVNSDLCCTHDRWLALLRERRWLEDGGTMPTILSPSVGVCSIDVGIECLLSPTRTGIFENISAFPITELDVM